MAVTIPAPEAVEGAELARELEAAGYVDVEVTYLPGVDDEPDELRVTGRTGRGDELDGRAANRIRGIVAEHRPPERPEPPLQRARRLTEELTDTATGDDVRAALLAVLDAVEGEATA